MISPEPQERDTRFCATCRRVLHPLSGGALVRYLHAEEARGQRVDHLARPVRPSELDSPPVVTCDFCSSPQPRYVYVAAPVDVEPRIVVRRTYGPDYTERHHAARIVSQRTAPGIGQNMGTRWSACADCAGLIDTRDVYGLVRRVMAAMPANRSKGARLARTRALLLALYQPLFATWLPDRGVITNEHPLGWWPPSTPDTQS